VQGFEMKNQGKRGRRGRQLLGILDGGGQEALLAYILNVLHHLSSCLILIFDITLYFSLWSLLAFSKK